MKVKYFRARKKMYIIKEVCKLENDEVAEVDERVMKS